MRKRIFTALVLSCICFCSYGQTIVHDEQNFAPDWYYYLFHNSYSGASTYWAWRGLHSGLHVRFRESDSNVKRIMPTRVISEETQRKKMKEVETERAKIQELYDEDAAKAADRNVDLVYSSFKDDFNRMQESISEGLLYCMEKSKGKMQYQIEQLTRQNEILCSGIEYIRRQGVGFELENTKREKAYIKARKEMEQLVSRVAHLVGMAQTHY